MQYSGGSRYIRGFIRRGDGVVRAEVNSRARLNTLLAEIRASVGIAEIVDDRIVDPKMDIPTPPPVGGWTWTAPVPQDPAIDAQREAWAASWVDEQVPALGGLTPRAAARGPKRKQLEMLLREFEFQEDRAAGGPWHGAGHISWLRDELDMWPDP